MPELNRPTVILPASARDTSSGPLVPHNRALEDEIDLGWYVQAVQRRWRLLLVGALLGASIGFVIAQSRPVRYEGVTTLMVVPPPRLQDAAVNPSTFSATTYRALLENGGLAGQVIEELGLDRAPHGLRPQKFLEEVLTVEEVRGTRLVKVRIKLSDPSLAADASKRLARKAIQLNQQLSQQEGTSVRDQLTSYLNDATLRLKKAEEVLFTYQKRAQIELLNKDTQALLAQRGDLPKLIIEIEGEKARLRSAEAEIKKQDRMLPYARALGAEEALRRTDDTKDVLDPSNPFVNPVYQSLDYQIAMSRSKLAALEQERRQLVEVSKLGGDELAKLSLLYGRQIELARLQNNYDLAKRIYSDLAVRYEESRTIALGNNAQLQLVDDAIPPDRPISRRRVQSSVLGLASGLLLAGLMALAMGSRERRKPSSSAAN